MNVLERGPSSALGHDGTALPTPVAEVERVTKTFGTGPAAVVALDEVSLEIARGAFFALLGPSGCGKTTLLRVFAGFEAPDRGCVRLDGRDVGSDPPNRREVNTVFQSYALFPHMTVAQNIAFGLERRGLDRSAVRRRVADMLSLVKLEAMGTRRPRELSGGQQQRVALARALAPEPKLLLLDEPLSALDLKLRRAMQVELKRLQRETGVTFLIVTHDQEEAFSVADRIAVMDQGRVLQVGAPDDIYARPSCRFIADFTGANVLAGARVGRDAAHVAVRPEHVVVVAAATGLKGTVESLSFRGATSLCLIALETGETIAAERADLPPGLAPGQEVGLRVEPDTLVALEN